jgi:hypothetical protein
MPANIKLPHEREEKVDMPPFETMDREIALRHASVHPDLGQEDMFGNKAPQPQDGSATMDTVGSDDAEDKEASGS